MSAASADLDRFNAPAAQSDGNQLRAGIATPAPTPCAVTLT